LLCQDLPVAIGRKLTISAKRKATPKDGFDKDFDNKAVGLPKTFLITIGMAERVGYSA
jgi:hypothetical protein